MVKVEMHDITGGQLTECATRCRDAAEQGTRPAVVVTQRLVEAIAVAAIHERVGDVAGPRSAVRVGRPALQRVQREQSLDDGVSDRIARLAADKLLQHHRHVPELVREHETRNRIAAAPQALDEHRRPTACRTVVFPPLQDVADAVASTHVRSPNLAAFEEANSLELDPGFDADQLNDF